MIVTGITPFQQEAFDAEAVALTADGSVRGPFSLTDDDAFKAWRDAKLKGFPTSVDELVVEVRDPTQPSAAESEAVRDRVRRAGMAVYAGPALDDVEQSKDLVRALGAHFGMTRLDQNPYADEDAITPLHVAAGDARLEQGRKLYIPYTSRAINWHTDGYYNTSDRRIRGMILHCVRQAGGSGGDNALFDPEMAYLLMRDHDPELVRAFAAMDAMTIPGNAMDEGVERGDVGGPVFSLNRADGSLY
ncbi:MAG TPA: TauD/TfdA family dioxygenase, partial [Magnetovibrio sp.]